MKYVLSVVLFLLLWPAAAYSNDCVILLHGLARSDGSMSKLAEVLGEEGYQTVNVSNPSRNYEIEKLADDSIPIALEKCSGAESINFVTHSMGGILVRQYLSDKKIENLNHVVMLGPPNKGSEVIDTLADFPGFNLINGPAGFQLGTGQRSVPNRLGVVDFSLGVIAGNKTINFILSTILPGADDGKVSVERTKVEGMADHLVMPVTHPFMMKNKRVIEQVVYFLKNDHFKR